MDIAFVLSSYSGIRRLHPARLSSHPCRRVWKEVGEEGGRVSLRYTNLLAHWLTGSLHWRTNLLAYWLTGSLAYWLTSLLAH